MGQTCSTERKEGDYANGGADNRPVPLLLFSQSMRSKNEDEDDYGLDEEDRKQRQILDDSISFSLQKKYQFAVPKSFEEQLSHYEEVSGSYLSVKKINTGKDLTQQKLSTSQRFMNSLLSSMNEGLTSSRLSNKNQGRKKQYVIDVMNVDASTSNSQAAHHSQFADNDNLSQSAHSSAKSINPAQIHDIEIWVRRFVEIYRLDVAESLQELDEVQQSELEHYLQEKQDNVKEEMGLQPNSDEGQVIEDYISNFHNITGSKAYKMFKNCHLGVDHYMETKNEVEAIKMMQISLENQLARKHQSVEDVDGWIFIEIMSKIYARVRYDALINIQKAVSYKKEMIKKDPKKFKKLNNSKKVNASDLLTEEEIREAGDTINFNYIQKRVLDLFTIDYYDVDCDQDLIMRKLQYLYLDMPVASEKETLDKVRIKIELESIKKAHHSIMQLIRDPSKQFPEMQDNPLKDDSVELGIPQQYFEILDECRKELEQQYHQNPQ